MLQQELLFVNQSEQGNATINVAVLNVQAEADFSNQDTAMN